MHIYVSFLALRMAWLKNFCNAAEQSSALQLGTPKSLIIVKTCFLFVDISVIYDYSFCCVVTGNKATGCASQHVWCMPQAMINWEGYGRKGIWRKNGGMMEVGRWLVRIEWRPSGLSVCLPLLSSIAVWSPEEDFFWHWLTRVVPEKGIKRLLYVCVSGHWGYWHGKAGVKVRHFFCQESLVWQITPFLK